MVQKAKKRDPKFIKAISIQNTSYTESTYVRTYSLEDASDFFEVQNEIGLNRTLSRKELLYDFVHELTHFLYRRPQNPYSPDFSLLTFIRNGVEERGGELDAFQMECLVAWQLEKAIKMPKHRLCQRYKQSKISGSKRFARERARGDYYAVGRFYSQLKGLVRAFPELTKSEVVFRSSLGKVPYPLALIQEYGIVRQRACQNNARKAELLGRHAARLQGRQTKTPNTESVRREIARLRKYQSDYCSIAGF